MTLSQQEIIDLRTYFVFKEGDNAIKGHFLPKETDIYKIGTVGQRFLEIHAKKIVVETIEGGGSTVTNADTVDNFHASSDPIGGTLLALDGAGVYPITTYPRALLVDGSRPLEQNLVTMGSVRLDGIDLDVHNHSGADGFGTKINHQDLLNKEADDHPQYTQWGDDEVLSGNWKWVPNVGPSYEPYTEGLIIEPDLYRIRSLSNNAFFVGSPTLAKVSLGSADNVMLYHDATETKLTLGTASNLIQLSPNHATHRFWIGNANPVLAPFQVEDDGTLRAGVAYLGDWEIITDYIKNADVELQPDGELRLGNGTRLDNDYAYLSSINPTYRLWVGNSNPAVAPLRVTKTGDLYMYNGYITGHVRSMNFQSGTSGYSFESSGRVEVNNLVARGRLDAIVFAKSTISAVSGTMIMSESGVLMEPVGVNDSVIVVDNYFFSRNDIIHLKPDAYREEWMRIVSPGSLNSDGNYEYQVTRDLGGLGKFAFKIGETVVRQGAAAQDQAMYPLAGGNESAEYGTYQPGGAGGASSGGWLVLEGGSGSGPYFGVVRRLGPVFDQVADVVRIGNLYGLAELGHTSETYGVFIGDASRYLTYDNEGGLVIKAREGATLINDDGVLTDEFQFVHTTDNNAPVTSGRTKVLGKSDGNLYIVPFGGTEKRLLNSSEVSATPVANKLLTLDSNAIFPSSVYPEAVLKELNERTITVGVGKDFSTIQAALNSLKGRLVNKAVYIDVDPGTYNENIVAEDILYSGSLTGYAQIRGDTRPLAGLSFVHGLPSTTRRTEQGIGTYSITNSGNTITVTATTTNPSFNGWGNGDQILILYSGATIAYTYTISSVSGNTITLTTTAPTMNALGVSITLVPNRRIHATSGNAVTCYTRLGITGFYITSVATPLAGSVGVLSVGSSVIAGGAGSGFASGGVTVSLSPLTIIRVNEVSTNQIFATQFMGLANVYMRYSYVIGFINQPGIYAERGTSRVDAQYCQVVKCGTGLLATDSSNIVADGTYVVNCDVGAQASSLSKINIHYSYIQNCTTKTSPPNSATIDATGGMVIGAEGAAQVIDGYGSVSFVVDGGGVVPSVGFKLFAPVPYPIVPISWTYAGAVSGSAVFALGSYPYSTFLSSGNSDFGGGTISSTVKGQGNVTSSPTIPAGDILYLYLNSVSSVTQFTVTLKYRKA